MAAAGWISIPVIDRVVAEMARGSTGTCARCSVAATR